jgi:D-arabinose 1-dehydrogenase-like Zn-dependent alcohol dehydrogenase
VFPLTISLEKLNVTPLGLVSIGASIVGSGGAQFQSLQTMLNFAAKNGIKAQIEKFPMTQVGVTQAMQKLKDGKMRYRGVLVVE